MSLNYCIHCRVQTIAGCKDTCCSFIINLAVLTWDWFFFFNFDKLMTWQLVGCELPAFTLAGSSCAAAQLRFYSVLLRLITLFNSAVSGGPDLSCSADSGSQRALERLEARAHGRWCQRGKASLWAAELRNQSIWWGSWAVCYYWCYKLISWWLGGWGTQFYKPFGSNRNTALFSSLSLAVWFLDFVNYPGAIHYFQLVNTHFDIHRRNRCIIIQ